MNENLVPFGKYKGQPLEVLQNDKKYLDWITSQDWFRQQYANIYNVIINNFQEPTETPEHNKIQVLFTDKVFIRQFYECLLKRNMVKAKLGFDIKYRVHPKSSDICAKSDDSRYYWGKNGEYVENYYDYGEDINIKIHASETTTSARVMYEEKGIDVIIRFWEDGKYKFPDFVYETCNVLGEKNIEIKPNLSDDYPAVLRQMKGNSSNILLIRTYDGKGATLDQVKKIFAASSIEIILLHEITT